MNRWPIQPDARRGTPRQEDGKRSNFRLIVWLMLLTLLLSACAPAANAGQPTAELASTAQQEETPQPGAKATRTPFPTRKVYGGTRTPIIDPTTQGEGSETVMPETTTAAGETAVVEAVKLTFGGSLNVRRGPGLAYDTVAAFDTGQTTEPVGRDANGEWLQVELPGSTGVYGWVYSKAPTVGVSGDPLTLPEAAFNEAVPAYVRNCTSHQISLLPGEIILESIAQQPANRVQVNPGFYEVVDLTLDSASVTTLSVTEGSELTITQDGNGVNYTCPR
jgi:hypothetical protein